MSLFAQYYKERLQYETLEVDDGFVVFSKGDKVWMIQEMFVKPESRVNGVGTSLLNCVISMAQESGAKGIGAFIWTTANNAETVLQAALSRGFRCVDADAGKITIYRGFV